MSAAAEKTAIVISGGGMRCAYSAGVLDALAHEMRFTSPDIAVAASGSVGNFFYYLAGQSDVGEQIWTKYLPTRKFVRFFPRPELHIDYLVDTVFQKLVPLDTERFRASPTHWYVPITNTHTGEPRFIESAAWFDPFEVMRAAKAIPFLYDGHVRLGGMHVMDGDITTDIADLIRKAVDAGATRILCITNVRARSAAMRRFLRMRARFSNPAYRKIYLKSLEPERVFELTDAVKVVTLSPAEPLPASLMTRSRRALRETFEMGYYDALEKRAEIEALFGTPAAPVAR